MSAADSSLTADADGAAPPTTTADIPAATQHQHQQLQPHLAKQDPNTVDPTKLTALSPEVVRDCLSALLLSGCCRQLLLVFAGVVTYCDSSCFAIMTWSVV
jgi:hypothetical protein